MIVQEVYDTHPEIRGACARNICGHAKTLEGDVADAMLTYGVAGDWIAESLALHTQTVIQGAFILAKCSGSADVAIESLRHLRRHLALLFTGETRSRPAPLQAV